jgi:chromosome segregation ATPase
MDELSIIVEGIGNKVKKLIIRNKQLKEKLLQFEEEKRDLLENIENQTRQIRELESRIASLQVARVLDTGDSVHARQKVNDLLREIEKCQVLLNR